MSLITNAIERTKHHFKDIRLDLYLVSIVFGISSWVVFSGIWVESSLLVGKLPEGWKIPSMIGAVSQLAQIGPIAYFFLKCKCLSCFRFKWAITTRKYAVPDRIIIYALFSIGIISNAFLALFWNKTVFIFGQLRSVYFFTCVFFLALLDCTCTIVFMTYVGKFKGNYINALYIGESISSLLPSLFALMQGVGEEWEYKCKSVHEPRFSISIYFWLLFGTILISFVAFLFLEFLPRFHKEKYNSKSRRLSRELKKLRNYYKSDYDEPEVSIGLMENNRILKRKKNLDKAFLFIGITLVSFTMYGFIPGVSTYAALPYGKHIMHLCSTLSLIIQTVSTLIAAFYQPKTTKSIWLILIIALAISSYIIVSAFLSPFPPLLNSELGGIIMVSSWVISFGLLMYLRCCIASTLKKKYTERSLIWCGLLTQFGQFVGSMIVYLLVDVFVIFKESDC